MTHSMPFASTAIPWLPDMPRMRGALAPGIQAGFTLLEMLLVVALLAATASISMALLGNREHQARYDSTVRRLDDIVHAVRGAITPAWDQQVRLSGFVTDNGRLPTSISELSQRDALVDKVECTAATSTATVAGLLNCYKPRAAVFDPTPDADGFENASGDELTLATAADPRVGKGLRRYLEGAAGSTQVRDGWSNVGLTDDDINFGWQLSLPATNTAPWTVVSLGSNNAVDASPPAEDPDMVTDIARSVEADDWSTSPGGWAVRVVNGSAVTLPPMGESLGVSLLVWVNQPGGGKWRRWSSTLDTTPLAPGEARDLVFPSLPAPPRVPTGEHPLMLFTQAGGSATPTVNGRRVATTARFYPGVGRPVVELVMR